jgi:hypothetical protein
MMENLWEIKVSYAMHPIDQTWGWVLTINNDWIGTYASPETAIKMAALESGLWSEVLKA